MRALALGGLALALLVVWRREVAGLFGQVTNVPAFLRMIRVAEGTDGPNGYYTLFGGQFFLEMDTHPAVRTYGEFNGRPGLDYTTAAGAYQITFTTWQRLAAKTGLTDFSPETQDEMARELIREHGAWDDVRAGRFDAAVAKLGAKWASLPSSTAPQARRSLDFVRAAYVNAGGSVAA
jgi:lysozyme